MDEQNKQPEQQPGQQPACEKKLSRTTLTFYIVGLFSVAIALILISYVAQARADRQLDTLTDQLTEQQTVAQGATQKVEDLQKQYDAQQQLIGSVEQALEKDAVLAETEDEDLAAAAGRIAARSDSEIARSCAYRTRWRTGTTRPPPSCMTRSSRSTPSPCSRGPERTPRSGF